MRVTHLSLKDFRSYAGAAVDLRAGRTTIVGRNGEGKTNLVEALGYVATLGSHRVSTDGPLVREGAERAVVRVSVEREGREQLVELEIVPGRANRARLNRSPAPRPRDVLGVLRTVLFAPEDLALVKGDPDGRRRFLDEVLVALAPRLAGVRADYEKVLRQRNALLRSARSRHGGPRRAREEAGTDASDTLSVWDAHLASAGAELLHARLHLVRRLAPHMGGAYDAVVADPVEPAGAAGPDADADAGAEPAAGAVPPPVATLAYRCSIPSVDSLDVVGGGPLPGRAELARALASQLDEVRAAELERGTTLAGPHRDDLLLELHGRPARGYASHGESWSFALALRLASWALMRGADVSAPSVSGAGATDDPVLVLDDVFAELDAGRRRRLAGLVAGAEQVLVTAAVDEDVPPELSGAVLRVEGGQVRADG